MQSNASNSGLVDYLLGESGHFTTLTGFNYTHIIMGEKDFFDKSLIESKRAWMDERWYYGPLLALFYLIVVFVLRRLMRNRERFEIRAALFLWNFGLAVFSTFGMIRFLPEFFYSLNKYGFEYSLCNQDYIFDVTGFWTYLFIMSKIPELIDTLFIVLRKQSLIFLHYYHHATVLMYAWYCYRSMPSSCRWFIAMNYSVHAMMYTYYAVKALNIRVPKQVAPLITSSQLAQMVVGCYINYSAWSFKKQHPEKVCLIHDDNIKWSFLMYLSYFFLFAKFFLDAYVFKTNRKSALEKKKAN